MIMPHSKLFSNSNNMRFILSSWVSCGLAHLGWVQLSWGFWAQILGQDQVYFKYLHSRIQAEGEWLHEA